MGPKMLRSCDLVKIRHCVDEVTEAQIIKTQGG